MVVPEILQLWYISYHWPANEHDTYHAQVKAGRVLEHGLQHVTEYTGVIHNRFRDGPDVLGNMPQLETVSVVSTLIRHTTPISLAGTLERKLHRVLIRKECVGANHHFQGAKATHLLDDGLRDGIASHQNYPGVETQYQGE